LAKAVPLCSTIAGGLLALVLLAAAPGSASAAAPEVLWQRCDGGLEDVSCEIPRGIAVDRTSGHVYIADQENRRIVELTAWGEFVKAWGWGVLDGSEEFQICTSLSSCRDGIDGGGAGQFSPLFGIAVDSKGDVYVVDFANNRVQKFDSAGNFVLMIGGEVNETKSEEVGSTEAQRNLCTAASGDVCQKGTTGTGKGQFGGWTTAGSFIATGAGDAVYVGDVGRVQVFKANGEYKEDLPDPEGLLAGGTVQSLAAGPSGSLYVALASKPDVRRLNATTGATVCTAKVASPKAAAADSAGNLYVLDQADPVQVHQFSSACVDKNEPFGAGELTSSTGLAAGSACLSSGADVYVSNIAPDFVRAYGPPPSKPACPKPAKAPTIFSQHTASAVTDAAEVRAVISPRFWADTTYYVQYGTDACLAGGWEAACVKEKPAAPGTALGGGAVDLPVATGAVFLRDLQPDTGYRYRFSAQSGGGGPIFGVGGEVGKDGADAGFHTFPTPTALSTPCPNALFRSGPSAQLPDCRAYEMVSPVDKDGADILTLVSNKLERPARIQQSSVAGDGFTYSAYRAFADAQSTPHSSQYIARRGAGGWSTQAISPPRGLLVGGPLTAKDREFQAFSDDLCQGWLARDNTTAPPLDPRAPEAAANVYQRSNCGAGAGGYEALITVEPPNREEVFLEMQGLTADGSQAIFRANDSLAPGVPDPGLDMALYEWHREPSDARQRLTVSASGGEYTLSARAALGRGTLTSGSATVSGARVLDGWGGAFRAGDAISGSGIPAGTTILTVGAETLTLSQNATASGERLLSAKETTAPLAVTAGAAGVQAALAALPAIGAANVNVSGGPGDATGSAPFEISFGGALAGKPVEALAATGTGLSGGTPSSAATVAILEPGGQLRGVCVLPGGVFSAGCSAGSASPQGNDVDGRTNTLANAISEDGSRIFWSSASAFAGAIYARVEGERTVPVSGAVTGGAAQFWAASAEGSKAIFWAGSASAGFVNLFDLYEFDLDAALAGAAEPARLIAPQVAGVLGASENATRVYLVSNAVCSGAAENSEGSKAQAGKPNLYLYREGEECAAGEFTFIGTLSNADAIAVTGGNEPSPVNVEPIEHSARVSPSGGTVAFMSTASLTGYDNTDINSGRPDAEVYRFDAASGELSCASCNPSGARPAGRNVATNTLPLWAAARLSRADSQLHLPRELSSDGTRLFFESFEALVSADTNSAQDVYEWEAPGAGDCSEASPAFSPSAEGCVSLISGGESPQDSDFLDASPSGDDVFIRTGASLVSNDPGLFDVYDARVGGGFPLPSARSACEGEACQSPPAPPQDATPASSSFEGEGNAKPARKARCPKGKRRVRRGGKSRCVGKRQQRRANHAQRRTQR
jgi:NHL repeat-containing protein